MESSDPHKEAAHSFPTYTVTRYAYGPDAFNFGDLYLPTLPGLHPVVPLLHGGFWRAAYDLTLMEGLADHLASRGIAAWNIEYRRVGNRGGGWPGTLQDVAQAVDHLRTIAGSTNVDLQHVVPIGHSAGGHLALWLAGRGKLPRQNLLQLSDPPLTPVGAISLAGAIDLELVWQLQLSNNAVGAFLGGSPAEFPERYAMASPASLLPLGITQVLIHGHDDINVPLAVSRAYAQKALKAGDTCKLIELPGIDHFEVINPSSNAWATTMQELQSLLTL